MLSQDDRRQLLSLLEGLPEMRDEQRRYQILTDAGLGHLADRIDLNGANAAAVRDRTKQARSGSSANPSNFSIATTFYDLGQILIVGEQSHVAETHTPYSGKETASQACWCIRPSKEASAAFEVVASS